LCVHFLEDITEVLHQMMEKSIIQIQQTQHFK